MSGGGHSCEPLVDECGRGPGAQPFKLGDRTAKGVLVVGVGERESGFVWTPDLRPERRGASPVPRNLERVGLGRWRGDLDRRIATLEALRNRLTTCIGWGCLSIDACELRFPRPFGAASCAYLAPSPCTNVQTTVGVTGAVTRGPSRTVSAQRVFCGLRFQYRQAFHP